MRTVKIRFVLIRDDGESWTAIGQPAHGWLSAQVARVWGNERFAAPEPLEDFCLGVEQHDIGWAAWDLRPPLHEPERRAASVFEAPLLPRTQLWEGASRRVLAQSPWAALLVSLHASNLYDHDVDDHDAEVATVVRRLVADERAFQDEQCAALRVARERAVVLGELLFALDWLSLALCCGWDGAEMPPVTGIAIRFEPQSRDVATLDPWPLSVRELEVQVHGRVLRERFSDERELHAGLDAAPWTRLSWTLLPA